MPGIMPDPAPVGLHVRPLRMRNRRMHKLRMLHRTAALTSGSGGLGLARIWAESNMAIRLEVTGDQVAIHAEEIGPLIRRERPAGAEVEVWEIAVVEADRK